MRIKMRRTDATTIKGTLILIVANQWHSSFLYGGLDEWLNY